MMRKRRDLTRELEAGYGSDSATNLDSKYSIL